jgi:hypothetical protein
MKSMTIAGALALMLALSAAAVAYGGTSGLRIPEGVYRANITEASLRNAGIRPVVAAHNAGVQTLIFRGSRWTNKTMNRYHPPDCSGDLSYAGNRVTLKPDRGPQCGTAAGGVLFGARWSFAHGLLRFTEIRPDDAFSRTAWGGTPWTKIG